jgi:hypothetical protein
MFVDDAKEGWRDIMDADEEFMLKLQRLDAITNTMGKLYECRMKNVIDQEAFENRIEFWLNKLDKYGLKDQGLEKLKQIKSGEKVINLMSCKTHGGNRK